VIIFVYVDDMGAVSPCQKAIDALKKSLESQLSIKDLGPLAFFLGIQVIRDYGCFHLSQATYVKPILAQFSMEDCAPVSTPMGPKLQLVKNVAEDPQLRTKFQSLRVAVLYLSRMTRPDIYYAVAALSRHCSNASSEHWVAAKQLLRYLLGSSKLGIEYQQSRNTENSVITRKSNASFASDLESRKSHQGYLFLAAGGPIIWQSRLQQILTRSTLEAEYVTLATASAEATWLRSLLNELG
jgi:hypothetical protein